MLPDRKVQWLNTQVADILDRICLDNFFTRPSWSFNLKMLQQILCFVSLLILLPLVDSFSQHGSPSLPSNFIHHMEYSMYQIFSADQCVSILNLKLERDTMHCPSFMKCHHLQRSHFDLKYSQNEFKMCSAVCSTDQHTCRY